MRRVGRRKSLKAEVRIVSATNRNLLEMVDMGRFRLDLYYRISGIDIVLPSLRERKSDIPALAETMLSRIVGPGMRYRLTAEAITLLQAYSYPGNIRELRNCLLKAVALSANGIIGAEHILLKKFNVVHKGSMSGRRALLPQGK